MENSPMALLPAEIRNRIYQYVLFRPEPLRIAAPSPALQNSAASAHLRQHQQAGGITALQRTCRQLQRESTQMLYRVSDFLVPFRRYERWDAVLQWFLTRIGRANARVVRQITVEVELSQRMARCWGTLVLEPLRGLSAPGRLGLPDLQLLVSFRGGNLHAVRPVMTLEIGKLEDDWKTLLEIFEMRSKPYIPKVCNHLALMHMMIWLQRCRVHGYWEYPGMAESIAGVGSRGYAFVGWQKNRQVAMVECVPLTESTGP